MGIIGIGRDKTDYYYNYGESKTYKRSAFGLFTEAGYKFNKLPNLFTKGNRLAHIMQGTYVKPSVTFGFYNDVVVHNKMGNLELDHRNNIFGAIILNLGHQWVIGDKFLVDLYYGLGFAFDNMKSDISGYNTNIIYNHFVVQKGGQGANFGVNGGLKIGLLF